MNGQTKKNSHTQKINEVLIHIQNHLGGHLSLECLAKIACMSSFHFHRIFTACVGESLHHHICRLRIERAAFKLRYSKDSITDIALSVGYETSAAFARGFKQHFGLSPSHYRKQPLNSDFLPTNNAVNNFSLSSIHCHIPSEIKTLPEQTLLFIRKIGSYQQVAKEAWAVLLPYAYRHSLLDEQTQFIGITHDDPNITTAEKIRYDACLSINRPHKTVGEVGSQRLAGGKYARFLHAGSYQTMRETYHKIYGAWLPNSGHQLRDLPSFSVYLTPKHDWAPKHDRDSEQCRSEIYIPIK